MQPESLIKLIGSGNTKTVEEEWMRIFESSEIPLAKLTGYDAVLAELGGRGQRGLAAEFAWAAIESLGTRHSPGEILTVAGPFLLAVGDSEDLRAQVTELYRTAHRGCAGLEALLKEAGIAGGRPVRRALRTLDVCLALEEGDFLIARDEDAAARVEQICRTTWKFRINLGSATETLAAVPLADAYQPAPSTTFSVLRTFAPEELGRRLKHDPAAVVIDICRQHDNKIDSDLLERLLVPEAMREEEWKKWWSRARTALKRCSQVLTEGRNPYVISYVDEGIALENTFLAHFERRRDPRERLEAVEKYLRECRLTGEAPSEEALRRCYECLGQRAQKATQSGATTAALQWVITAHVGALAGIKGAPSGAVEFFRAAPDLAAIFGALESGPLVEVACQCLVEAMPNEWPDRLRPLVPILPQGSCDGAVSRLREVGCTDDELGLICERILQSPVEYFEALLWLWDGPAKAEVGAPAQPIAVLMRILRALDDARLSDTVPRKKRNAMGARARSALSARKYERFGLCLETLESGMALALRTQLQRSEALGRAVREDLLKRISARFPFLEQDREVAPWAQEEVVYVTKAGLARRQKEIDEHINVKMRENARAIGRAAEHGDLSENSEYKFALEERDLLRARLAQMNQEIAIAKVIDPEEISTDHIGIGTQAVFRRRSDGREYEMSFLGPWEADVAKGVFNYKAPLPQRLMGKRAGDVVEFDHTGAEGEYEIIAVRNALAP